MKVSIHTYCCQIQSHYFIHVIDISQSCIESLSIYSCELQVTKTVKDSIREGQALHLNVKSSCQVQKQAP